MRFPGFIGPTYTSQSINVDCQYTLNLYPEIDEQRTGKAGEIASLVSTPGLTSLLELGDGPIRGLYTSTNNILFAVSRDKLYKIDSDLNSTFLGAINTVSGVVNFADNGLQLVLVDGPYGYIVDLNTFAFSRIDDEGFYGATHVCCIDGFLLFNKPDTNIFYKSGLYDVNFDATEFGQAEGNPDKIIALASVNRQLIIFGDRTTEVWYDSGNPDFPFERIQGAFNQFGCIAPNSVATLGNNVFWLGQNENGAGIVFTNSGYQAQRISNHAIENMIKSYSSIESATAWAYQENGHAFYVLNFEEATLVYDISTQQWHNRGYSNQGEIERHRANCHAFCYGIHFVGDYQTNNIYKLDDSIYTDNGNPITRIRTSPHITDSLKRVFYKSFQLDLEAGIGLDGNNQGSDPNIILQYSDDGGHTWSNEAWRSPGRIGQYKARALWRRLGFSRDRVFRVKISDPIKVTLIGAELELETGRW